LPTIIPITSGVPAALLPTTRQELRRFLGQATSGDLWLVDAVKATPLPKAGEIALDGLIDSEADPTAYRDRWLYRVATGEERRVVAVDPDTGQIRPHRPFAADPAAAESVELHRFPPSTIHQAINDGLARCTHEDLVPLTIVDGQEAYDLSVYSYIKTRGDVIGVYTKGTQTGNETPFQEVGWARPEWISDRWWLYLSPPLRASSDMTLYLRVLRPYDALAADSDGTACPVEWARAATRVALYDLIIPSLGPAKERQRYDQDRADALRKFRRFSKLRQPKPATKIQFNTSQQWSLW
jgi:hypothetical protein